MTVWWWLVVWVWLMLAVPEALRMWDEWRGTKR